MTGPIYYFAEAETATAAEHARASFKYFWRELSWERRRIIPGFDNACVKVAFGDRGAVEHMWICDVEFDGEEVVGTLMNSPNEISGVAEGDEVRASFAERVGDWMLLQGNKALGGFSVQAIRRGMDKLARQDHDQAWGIDFGDPSNVQLPPTGDDHPMAINMVPSLGQYLAENPTEVSGYDDSGFTMLHREALAGNACIVAALLERGADVNAKTRSGKSALGLARTLQWSKVEELLTKAGARA